MALEPTLTETIAAAPAPPASESHTGQIARAAGVLSLGSVASRVLGFCVYLVKSQYFGAGGKVDAFTVAAEIPNMLYDLLVGGMVNSALVPVFIEYVTDRRDELWGLISMLCSLIIAALAVVVLIAELLAPQIVGLVSGGSPPDVQAMAASMFRIMVPAVIFLSLSGVLTGALLALRRPTWPAFVGAVMNAGTVLVTILLHNQLDITSMAVGILAGSICQVLLQAPGLRDARLRFRLSLSHPALRQVAILYAPIAFSLVLDTLISRPISYNLASHIVEGGISWMDYATTLREMPQGFVGVAISLAVLPLLALHARNEKTEGLGPFRQTLARGLRLGIVLIVPAAVGLFVLSRPMVALVFEHGVFTAHDTDATTQALRWYLMGVPFATVDLLLVYAFYARQDTLTPPLIGVAVTIVYLAMAFLLIEPPAILAQFKPAGWWALVAPTGLFVLMFADSFKLGLHSLISWVILNKRINGLGAAEERGVIRTVLLTLLAAAVMAGATYATLMVTRTFIAEGELGKLLVSGPLGQMNALQHGQLVIKLVNVAVPALVGAGVYVGLVTLFRVEEIHMLWGAIKKRLVGA